MKNFLTILLVLSFLGPALALTPAERAIVQHVQQLNARQKTELNDTNAKLTWVFKELSEKEPQIQQLGKERDQWKGLYDSDHEKLLKSESAILRRNILIGGLFLAIGAWAFLKFYLHVPFL